MHKQVVSVLTLGAVLGASLQRPEPVRANPAAVQAAIGACAANPGLCAVVGAGAATWLLWSSGNNFYCTAYTCQRTNQVPREFQQNNGDSFYNPATEEFTLANNRDGCKEKEKRVKKAHPDWDVWLSDMKRNRSQGTFNEILCIWQGRDRKLLKRYYSS